MPPPNPSQDVAGVAVIASAIQGLPGLSSVSRGALDIAIQNGGPVGVLKLVGIPDTIGPLSFPLVIKSLDLTINGTTDAHPSVPFTRLPTKCTLAITQVSVQTYAASSPNGSATSSFTPSACNARTPAFTPTLTASATRDANDNGVQLITTVSQPASVPPNKIQAGTLTTALGIPFTVVRPNVGNAAACLSSGGCTIGRAIVRSPLLAGPLQGTLSLQPPASSPNLTVTFPPPIAFSFSGVVNLGTGVTTFSNLPDVPLNSLEVIVDGGANAAFAATCNPASGVVTGRFTAQNGATATSNAPFTVQRCPPFKGSPPTVSDGALTGLAKGHPTLRFNVTAGTNAPELKALTVSLPHGVSFVAKKLKSGLTLSGATLKHASIRHGRLLITFAESVGFSVTVSRKAIKVTESLSSKAKKHKLKKLSGSVTATDASGKSTKLKLPFRKLN
jgi:hypothetical protein